MNYCQPTTLRGVTVRPLTTHKTTMGGLKVQKQLYEALNIAGQEVKEREDGGR